MSIEKISKEPKVLEARRTVVVSQSLALIGSLPFQVNLQQNQIDFVPTRMAIRQISYVNQLIAPGFTSLGSEQGIYTLYCSLSRQPAAFITCGPLLLTATTEQVINIPTYNPIIEFQLIPTASSTQASTVNPGQSVLVSQPAGFLAMSLEFF